LLRLLLLPTWHYFLWNLRSQSPGVHDQGEASAWFGRSTLLGAVRVLKFFGTVAGLFWLKPAHATESVSWDACSPTRSPQMRLHTALVEETESE
ncbi:hypothetical protein ACFV5G_08435, partial [Streptomyces sp. NPDC059766]|uniref:hypothetical protein n=1 Tax=Streptomyces sp. NPDC059766 TaxID=3346940 RepID=UPI003648E2C8